MDCFGTRAFVASLIRGEISTGVGSIRGGNGGGGGGSGTRRAPPMTRCGCKPASEEPEIRPGLCGPLGTTKDEGPVNCAGSGLMATIIFGADSKEGGGRKGADWGGGMSRSGIALEGTFCEVSSSWGRDGPTVERVAAAGGRCCVVEVD